MAMIVLAHVQYASTKTIRHHSSTNNAFPKLDLCTSSMIRVGLRKTNLRPIRTNTKTVVRPKSCSDATQQERASGGQNLRERDLSQCFQPLSWPHSSSSHPRCSILLLSCMQDLRFV